MKTTSESKRRHNKKRNKIHRAKGKARKAVLDQARQQQLKQVAQQQPHQQQHGYVSPHRNKRHTPTVLGTKLGESNVERQDDRDLVNKFWLNKRFFPSQKGHLPLVYDIYTIFSQQYEHCRLTMEEFVNLTMAEFNYITIDWVQGNMCFDAVAEASELHVLGKGLELQSLEEHRSMDIDGCAPQHNPSKAENGHDLFGYRNPMEGSTKHLDDPTVLLRKMPQMHLPPTKRLKTSTNANLHPHFEIIENMMDKGGNSENVLAMSNEDITTVDDGIEYGMEEKAVEEGREEVVLGEAEMIEDINIHFKVSREDVLPLSIFINDERMARLAQKNMSSIEEFWDVFLESEAQQMWAVDDVHRQFNQYVSGRPLLKLDEFVNLTMLLEHVKIEVIGSSIYFIVKSRVPPGLHNECNIDKKQQPDNVMVPSKPSPTPFVEYFTEVGDQWRRDKCHMFNLPQKIGCPTDSGAKKMRRGRPIEIRKVQGDGNCFFRALSVVLTGTELNHPSLRKALHQHMCSHPNITYTSRSQLQRRINIIRRNGTWATDVEIYYMAHLLQTDIHVFKKQYLNDWHTFYGNGKLPNDTQMATTESIQLVNTNSNHYDVVQTTFSERANGEVAGKRTPMYDDQRKAGPSGLSKLQVNRCKNERDRAAEDLAHPMPSPGKSDCAPEPLTSHDQGDGNRSGSMPRHERGTGSKITPPGGSKAMRTQSSDDEDHCRVEDNAKHIVVQNSSKWSAINNKVDTSVLVNLVRSFWEKSLGDYPEMNTTWNKAYRMYCEGNIHLSFIDFRKSTVSLAQALGLVINKSRISKGIRGGPTDATISPPQCNFKKSGKHRVSRKQVDEGMKAVNEFIQKHYQYSYDNKEEVTLRKMFHLYEKQEGKAKR